MAFRHEGHNHGSYRRSNKQTKASDTLPGIILSVAEMCDSVLPPSRKHLSGIHAWEKHLNVTDSSCIKLINNQPASTDMVIRWSKDI